MNNQTIKKYVRILTLLLIITNMLGDSLSNFKKKKFWLPLSFSFELVVYPKALLVHSSDQ